MILMRREMTMSRARSVAGQRPAEQPRVRDANAAPTAQQARQKVASLTADNMPAAARREFNSSALTPTLSPIALLTMSLLHRRAAASHRERNIR